MSKTPLPFKPGDRVVTDYDGLTHGRLFSTKTYTVDKCVRSTPGRSFGSGFGVLVKKLPRCKECGQVRPVPTSMSDGPIDSSWFEKAPKARKKR